MIKTLNLLEEKNNYLEKFVALNRLQLRKLQQNDFAELEDFRECRENILNIVKHIDARIEQRTENVPTDLIPPEAKVRLQSLLDGKDELVHTILAQDLEIMQIIESAKSQIIVELQSVKKVRKGISSYKSFNKKESVDEEA